MNEGGIWAVSRLDDTNGVATAAPLKVAWELFTNEAPFSVSVKPGPPICAIAGAIVVGLRRACARVNEGVDGLAAVGTLVLGGELHGVHACTAVRSEAIAASSLPPCLHPGTGVTTN